MTELVIIEKLNAATVFTETGMDKLLEIVIEKVEDFKPDLTTAKGRKEIASRAYKVSQSKTLLDGLGKDLMSDWNAKVGIVNVERKKMRDRLDLLRIEIRKPLTDYEETETERVAEHDSNLFEIVNAGMHTKDQWQTLPINAMKDRLKEIETELMGDRWEEYAGRAAEAKDNAIALIKNAIEMREKYDSEQAELAALREEKERQAQIDRENAIRKEAADQARREAEEKAAADARKQAEIEEEKSRKAEQEKLAAIQEKEAAELATKQAEEAAKNATEQERLRAQAQKDADDAEAKRREDDINHKRKINKETVSALVNNIGLNDDQAKEVVRAIALGEIPNVKIVY